MSTQHELGQFYSARADELLDGMTRPPKGAIVVEPFAGEGDLLKWLGPGYIELAYDIDPKRERTIRRDTLMTPPRYSGSYVLTNPPWLAKNKSENKAAFEKWGTDDLYKCFLKSLFKDPPTGGIIIIPLNFFSGDRDSEKKRRTEFFRTFTPQRINIFETAMFADTDYLTMVIQFQKRTNLYMDHGKEENITMNFYPSRDTMTLRVNPLSFVFPNENPFETLPPPATGHYISVRRHEEDKPLKATETLTLILFEALDSGVSTTPGDGRIGLQMMEPDQTYLGKSTSRSKAQIVVRGPLSRKLQRRIVTDFNAWIEDWRQKTRSIFLPVFREAKEYPRRRLSFHMAFDAIRNLIWHYSQTSPPDTVQQVTE